MPTWETSTDWDNATSETGTMHDSLSNTDYNDATTLDHAVPVGSTDANITNGLVGHWPLQEDTGSTAFDFSGNNNDGTVNGATQGATGLLGTTAYDFDGVDDGVVIPNQEAFDNNFTLSGWMFLTDKSSDSALATADKNEGGGGMSWALWYDKGIDEFLVFDGNDKLSSDRVIDKNEWYFVTWYHENGISELFVNGVQEAAGSLNPSKSTTEDIIGLGDTAGGKAMTGRIASVRIYNRALSESEVQTLYDNVTGTASLTTVAKSL